MPAPTRPVILGNGTTLAPIGSAVESTYRIGESVALSLQSSAGYASFAWAVIGKPADSSVALGSLTGFTSTIAADVAGEYVIKGTATNADGTSSARVSLIVVRSAGRGVRKAAAIRSQDVAQDVDHIKSLFNDFVDEHDFSARVFNVRKYGAQGDGATNDRGAFALAIAAAYAVGGCVYVPAGRFVLGSQLALPARCSLIGASRLDSVILCGFDGTLFTVDDDNRFEKLYFDGQGSTYASSRIFTIAGTKARTHWSDCGLINSGSYAVEWLQATAGSQSVMHGCTVYRYGGDYAMRVEDVEQLTAVPKKFIACESSGGKFIDLGGSNDTAIVGGYIAGVKFSTHTSGTVVTARVADPAGTIMDGSNNAILAGPIAGPVGGPCLTLAASARGCKVSAIFNSANPVLDLSTASDVNVNQVDVPKSTWTPTVTSSGAAVNLGDGAVVSGHWSRNGVNVTAVIELTWGGAGLSVPVGLLEFSIPASIVPRSATPETRHGSGYVQQGGAVKPVQTIAIAPPGNAFFRALGESGYLTNINPFAWAAGDTIRLSITYML